MHPSIDHMDEPFRLCLSIVNGYPFHTYFLGKNVEIYTSKLHSLPHRWLNYIMQRHKPELRKRALSGVKF